MSYSHRAVFELFLRACVSVLSRTEVVVVLIAIASASALLAQNTEATVLGTVKDPSGSVVAGASVHLNNQGTSAQRTATTDVNGDYRFTGVDIGAYVLLIEAPGFQQEQFSQFDLLARETRRFDVALKVASQAQSVDVQATNVPDVQTDTSNIAETKTGRELIDLPVAIATRAAGSTSPISTLTTQPGVQTDQNGNISVAGSNPAQLSVSIDGISVIGGTSDLAGPIAELFPSFNAIEEIRVSEVVNPAEYGGVADITTITKSGTNTYHGGVFENLQNSELNASNTFTNTTPTLKMNNFGIYMGGPIVIPKLYDGRNRTFFFGSYEALRRPDQTIEIESVPSLAMRSGDLTSLGGPVLSANQLSPLSQKMLQYLFPLPNYGPAGATSNNFAAYFPTPIFSNQADLRFDQQLTSKQSVNFHMTYKNRRVDVPSNGTASLGSFSVPEIDYALIGGYTYVISPSVVNELKGGIAGNHTSTSYGLTAAQIASDLGIGAGFSIPSGDAIPGVIITGYQPTEQFFGTYSSETKSRGIQLLDTLTWTRAKHTLKFGGDFRYLNAYYSNSYAQSRLGYYVFNGSLLSSLQTNGVQTAAQPFESFLLGYPDLSGIATIVQPNNEFYAPAYAVFVQDDWKISSRVTINYGLRWEYHPMMQDHLLNITNFDPDYKSVVNGQQVPGAVIIPSQAAFGIVNPSFVQSIAPTPILTAAQDGLPPNMRFSQKTDFAPRFGIAWKPLNNNRTVVRGGYGRFIEALTGGLADDGGTVASSDFAFFPNSVVNGKPQYSFPYPFPSNLAVPGSQEFAVGFPRHFQDPTVQEWDFTVEQDLGKGIGLRLSYDGNHSSDLGVIENLDQVPPNTVGFAAASAFAPYPIFEQVLFRESDGVLNYNAFTASVHKRFSGGLQFQASYTLAKNLSDATGFNPSGASFEQPTGGVLSNPADPRLDYGNVAFTARQRFLATFLYELPIGKGRHFASNSNKLVDGIIGGWEFSGVIVAQTGPFMTITAPGDPSGTGFNVLQADGRADTVPGVPLYAGQSLNQWVNPAAFTTAPSNIGRFGDSSIGSVVGPGETVVSLSLLKRISFNERVRMQVGAAAANAFNHPNYAMPGILDLGYVGAGFGQISNLQTAEGAGPRSIQLTGRITF
ncbi:MAG: carboxypeptidase-like regulatory domain-containing protein [Bryobacteraceae bacterium]